MTTTLRLAAFLSLLAAPAVAQDEEADRRALARALASINEDEPEGPALPRRGDGFFGEGFFIDTAPAATGPGAERFGGRETPSTLRDRGTPGRRLYSR
jgi:hypothetical protein